MCYTRLWHSRISTRRLAAQTNISQSVVFRILKEQQLHPFHYRQAQDILPQDLSLLRQFCQLLLYRHAEDPSDESTFTRSGVFNMHNEYVWAEENPHARKVTHYQQSFKINVWVATLRNSLLGYHIIPGNLNGELYQEFLATRFHEFLEDIPLARRGALRLEYFENLSHQNNFVIRFGFSTSKTFGKAHYFLTKHNGTKIMCFGKPLSAKFTNNDAINFRVKYPSVFVQKKTTSSFDDRSLTKTTATLEIGVSPVVQLKRITLISRGGEEYQ
ncbi:hypothetical protein NQ318_021440 [Aromia moschata]|uniref:Uncharacterized protein n=1 Tax=Aromia moschata TaxID=1265417 RepID=A0AAV8ZEN8_9CUCU|nr:hypothetical protein NQ318_021440 [Aromia moschata]